MTGGKLPKSIVIPLANPRTAADLVRIGAGVLQEGGAITGRVVTSQFSYACALGGADGRHLLACTGASAVARATMARSSSWRQR